MISELTFTEINKKILGSWVDEAYSIWNFYPDNTATFTAKNNYPIIKIFNLHTKLEPLAGTPIKFYWKIKASLPFNRITFDYKFEDGDIIPFFGIQQFFGEYNKMRFGFNDGIGSSAPDDFTTAYEVINFKRTVD